MGGDLKPCSMEPLTGFCRNGYCSSFPEDVGGHLVCVEVTEDFLLFSKVAGNDLSTAFPEMGFPGLKPGDRWCLCAIRWQEAFEAGVAPPVVLSSTHEDALNIVNLKDLQAYACG